MIEGLAQEVKYESSASRLYTLIKQNGKLTAPDSAPTIAIYNPGGTSRVSATSMTMVPVNTSGGRALLAYDAQTAAFQTGATLTGGTSGAVAQIDQIQDAGTTGVLVLRNIWGTFQNNETITDDGDSTGSATANGAAYTTEYYYDLDASSTTNYSIGENYYGIVTYIIGTVTFTQYEYFDVVMFPFTEPLITDDYIRRLHPDWAQAHPDGEDATFIDHIELAHAELSRRIRALGNRPAFIVKRDELLPYELAFTEAEIAKRLTRMDPDQRDFWISNAENLWQARGEFLYDSDDDEEVDDGVKVLSSRFTR